jgi:hypothetical protein
MLPGTPFAASLVQYISIATLFDGCWHPRDRHERLRHLIEQLACVLFFTQRHREKLDDLGLAHLHRQVSGSRVRRHFIMLDPLRGPDQGEIGGSIVLFLASCMTSSPSSTGRPCPCRVSHAPQSPTCAGIH